MSYTQVTPLIMVPAPIEEPIEDVYDYRIGVLCGMIYDDNIFTSHYYKKTYIPYDYISTKLSEKLMIIMINKNVIQFKQLYKFCQTHQIHINYKSGWYIWFSSFIKHNLYEMVHDEMKTMKLNQDNSILLCYGKSSPILNKLKDIFRDIKLDYINATRKLVSDPTSPLFDYIDIFRFLNTLPRNIIQQIQTNLYRNMCQAFDLEIGNIHITTSLLQILLIFIKKRKLKIVTFNIILGYLDEVTTIPNHHIAQIIDMHYSMAPEYYPERKDAKIFI